MIKMVSDDTISRVKRPRQVLVRLNNETYDKLESLALRYDITVSAVVRIAVARMLGRSG